MTERRNPIGLGSYPEKDSRALSGECRPPPDLAASTSNDGKARQLINHSLRERQPAEHGSPRAIWLREL
jgi:hypothetical protein